MSPVRRPSKSRAPAKASAKPPARASANASAKPPALSGSQRRYLRGLAHTLEPVVQVGHGGVSEGVVAAVDQALTDHELIKVRLHEPEDKRAMAEEIARASRAVLCGLVGHTAILYRPHPDAPRIQIPR